MIRNSSGFVFHLETHLPLRSSTEPIHARLNLTFIVITRRHEARNKFMSVNVAFAKERHAEIPRIHTPGKATFR